MTAGLTRYFWGTQLLHPTVAMNASPYFRYYAAFVLIMVLALLLRVQAHAAPLVRAAGTWNSGLLREEQGQSGLAWRK